MVNFSPNWRSNSVRVILLFVFSSLRWISNSWLWCDPKSWISLVLPSWRQRVVLVYECRKLLRLPAVGLFSKERFSLLTRTEKGPACNWTTTSSGELGVGPARATRPQFSADHFFPSRLLSPVFRRWTTAKERLLMSQHPFNPSTQTENRLTVQNKFQNDVWRWVTFVEISFNQSLINAVKCNVTFICLDKTGAFTCVCGFRFSIIFWRLRIHTGNH